MFYAIVSFGGAMPGPKVFRTKEEAIAHIVQVERDTLGNGEYYCDPQVTARARVNEYLTRESADAGDISDTTNDSGRKPTEGFVQTVFVRS